MTAESENRLFLNGINAATGDYLLPPVTPANVATMARGRKLDPDEASTLKSYWKRMNEGFLAPMEGVDPKDLSQTGWAVVFPQDVDPAIPEALSELLEHRKREATRDKERLFQDCRGPRAYRPGEAPRRFLERMGAGSGAVDPERFPYYVLLVGSPEQIPYRFQHQLDVQYAVGRIHFDTPEEYAAYARSVVVAERSRLRRKREVVLFGTQNPDDLATALSSRHLVTPLAEKLARSEGWQVRKVVGEEATKARLSSLFQAAEQPALLFTASHGIGVAAGDPKQRTHQGALLCQDWPGRESHRGPLPERFYFGGEDLSADMQLAGLITFHFACYGAGTPQLDEFWRQALDAPAAIAPAPFVAHLPKRLLARGALAAVGHVDRAWSCSFHSVRTAPQTSVYESTFKRLLTGHPVGSAMEYFNQRYAELATELTAELEDLAEGKDEEPDRLVDLWLSHNDARNFTVVGDPAVKLMA